MFVTDTSEYVRLRGGRPTNRFSLHASSKRYCDLIRRFSFSAVEHSSFLSGKEFIVAVTHFPRDTSSSVDVATGEVDGKVVGTGSTIYRRMISFENDEKRIDIIGTPN